MSHDDTSPTELTPGGDDDHTRATGTAAWPAGQATVVRAPGPGPSEPATQTRRWVALVVAAVVVIGAGASGWTLGRSHARADVEASAAAEGSAASTTSSTAVSTTVPPTAAPSTTLPPPTAPAATEPAPAVCPNATELEEAFRRDEVIASAVLLGDGLVDIQCAGGWIRAFTSPSGIEAAAVFFRNVDGTVEVVDAGTGVSCEDLGIGLGEDAASLCG